MSYTITTVAETIGRINRELYIPGIQRPYVWTRDQIIRLFDSRMRKYPIGTLLLWDIPHNSREDWEVYRFIENFWEGDIHNDAADVPENEPCVLVLDGQQRLTSLLIGLKGTYTVKKKHKRRSNADAWEEVALHLNLAHAPAADDAIDENDSPLSEHYQFRFFDVSRHPKNDADHLWFEVSFILTAATEQELQRLELSWIDNNSQLSAEKKAVARQNLRRLWEMVWQDQAMAYFTEQSDSYDRVLDIFIRANDGGTRLSRSDLLMSVITLRWEQFNAREETEALLDALAEQIEPKKKLQREFLLRSALFLNDLNFTIQVKNFTPANIRKLEESWESVKAALLFSARWLRAAGLYGENLSGHNVVMLLAYYFHRAGIVDEPSCLSDEEAEKIRQWVITIQFQKLLSLQVNSTLAEFRTTVRRHTSQQKSFPLEEAARMFSRKGRQFGFNDEWVDTFCSQSLKNRGAEKLLSLVYGQDLAVAGLRPVELVQPRYFLPEELRRAGLPEALHASLRDHAGTLGLAVALSQPELDQYYQLPFEQWAQTLTPDQLRRHCLPEDISLYRIQSLPELIALRKQAIAERLTGNLPEVKVA